MFGSPNIKRWKNWWFTELVWASALSLADSLWFPESLTFWTQLTWFGLVQMILPANLTVDFQGYLFSPSLIFRSWFFFVKKPSKNHRMRCLPGPGAFNVGRIFSLAIDGLDLGLKSLTHQSYEACWDDGKVWVASWNCVILCIPIRMFTRNYMMLTFHRWQERRHKVRELFSEKCWVWHGYLLRICRFYFSPTWDFVHRENAGTLRMVP